MTYPGAVEFLHGLSLFGYRPGLDTARKLAALAGNPQDRLHFIHVAGTNGKGSTCAMLESVYRSSGLKTGMFTSPHLVSFTERIQVNRQFIPEAEIVRLVGELQGWMREFPPGEQPTFFEAVTVLALCHFAARRCELVIWETGLGGRLDATNIVTPLASVITNIQFDHQNWLGNTLAAIAREKAGIIKPGIPVITGTEEPEALGVIRAIAGQNGARLVEVSPDDASRPPLDTLELPLLGEHQRMNAAVTAAVVRALATQLPVSDEVLRAGLATTRWAGRLQTIQRANQTLLLDGAHNVAGAKVLRAAFTKHFGNRRMALVLGALQDKQWAEICGILAPLANQILLAPVASERTTSPAQLAAVCQAANPAADVIICQSLAEALQFVASVPLVVVTGSLYLVGEALELLGGGGGPSERALNEWQPRPVQ